MIIENRGGKAQCSNGLTYSRRGDYDVCGGQEYRTLARHASRRCGRHCTSVLVGSLRRIVVYAAETEPWRDLRTVDDKIAAGNSNQGACGGSSYPQQQKVTHTAQPNSRNSIHSRVIPWVSCSPWRFRMTNSAAFGGIIVIVHAFRECMLFSRMGQRVLLFRSLDCGGADGACFVSNRVQLFTKRHSEYHPIPGTMTVRLNVQ